MKIDGLLYRICTWIYQFAYLNVLFLLSCIPIITIYPAFAAMFGVVREWHNKNEVPIFSTYRRLFLENFKQSLAAGIVITAIGLILLGDFYLLTKLNTSLNLFIFSCVSLITFCFISSVLYVFPLMVNSYYTFKQLAMNSFKFGLYRFSLTAANFIILAVWLYVSLKFSFFFMFFFFSVCAFITYWFAGQKLSTLESASQTHADRAASRAQNVYLFKKHKKVNA